MEAFLISLSTVALAEMGDRTQLLTLVLATQYRRPVPIILGILVATLANHAAAALLGVWIGHALTPTLLDAIVGTSMLGMALWTLKPDTLKDEKGGTQASAFVATLVSFFIAEIGDKTQIATIALAAGYSNLAAVVAGTTSGMLAANIPVVFLGNAFASRLPMQKIHYGASALFILLGLLFIGRAVAHWTGLV